MLYVFAVCYSLLGSISISLNLLVFFLTFYMALCPSLLWSFSLALILFPLVKSAQLPFSTWLVSAMSAPTPVSALLHSSTMVIAGIYTIILLFPVYSLLFVSNTLIFYGFISIVILTLIWSLIMACNAYDIKSLIAYSTVSQLSYMFIGLLVSPSIVILHIILHAFFKSTLFLVAGGIIHASNHYQSIYRISVNSSYLYILIINNMLMATALSKEIIIYAVSYYINSLSLSVILSLSTVLTSLYSILLLRELNVVYGNSYTLTYVYYSLWSFVGYNLQFITSTPVMWTNTLSIPANLYYTPYSLIFLSLYFILFYLLLIYLYRFVPTILSYQLGTIYYNNNLSYLYRCYITEYSVGYAGSLYRLVEGIISETNMYAMLTSTSAISVLICFVLLL